MVLSIDNIQVILQKNQQMKDELLEQLLNLLKFTWFGRCVKEFDITEIGEQYSLKDTIQNLCIKEINKQAGYNKDFHGNLKNLLKKHQKIKS